MLVVPYVGTWIEIGNWQKAWQGIVVVPYVGTWIEIQLSISGRAENHVVPYVGTWIEIAFKNLKGEGGGGRSLRGNVDRNFDMEGSMSMTPGSFPTWERG